MYAGLGIGLASRGGLAVAERSGALVRVLPRWTWAAVPVYALLPAGRNRIPRVRIVLEWLSSWLGSAFD
jgi:DNA-binding transcriptional LysR family regulator